MTSSLPERVVIISDFATVEGGASKLAVLQAGLLAERGIPVTFVSGDEGGTFPDQIEAIAFGGRKLMEQGKFSAAVGGLWNGNVKTQLADWVAANDTASTVYHVHGYHQTLSPSVLAPLQGVRQRTIMHAHDYFLACPNGAFFDFRAGTSCDRRGLSASCVARNCDKRSYGQKMWRVTRQFLQNRTRERLLPDVTTILIHAGMENRMFSDGSGGHVRVVPNPAKALVTPAVSAAENADILYIGDIHAYKGVFLLAEAARRAGVAVRFVGDGQDRAALQRDYPEHHFDGWQDREGLCRLMASARLMVAPTLGPEPFGLAPVEALLSGVPVLMSDSMLLSADILENDMGRCFRAGDCDALSGVLQDLAVNDAAIARMSSNAQNKASDLSLATDEWCTALLDIYRSVLDR